MSPEGATVNSSIWTDVRAQGRTITVPSGGVTPIAMSIAAHAEPTIVCYGAREVCRFAAGEGGEIRWRPPTDKEPGAWRFAIRARGDLPCSTCGAVGEHTCAAPGWRERVVGSATFSIGSAAASVIAIPNDVAAANAVTPTRGPTSDYVAACQRAQRMCDHCGTWGLHECSGPVRIPDGCECITYLYAHGCVAERKSFSLKAHDNSWRVEAEHWSTPGNPSAWTVRRYAPVGNLRESSIENDAGVAERFARWARPEAGTAPTFDPCPSDGDPCAYDQACEAVRKGGWTETGGESWHVRLAPLLDGKKWRIETVRDGGGNYEAVRAAEAPAWFAREVRKVAWRPDRSPRARKEPRGACDAFARMIMERSVPRSAWEVAPAGPDPDDVAAVSAAAAIAAGRGSVLRIGTTGTLTVDIHSHVTVGHAPTLTLPAPTATPDVSPPEHAPTCVARIGDRRYTAGEVIAAAHLRAFGDAIAACVQHPAAPLLMAAAWAEKHDGDPSYADTADPLREIACAIRDGLLDADGLSPNRCPWSTSAQWAKGRHGIDIFAAPGEPRHYARVLSRKRIDAAIREYRGPFKEAIQAALVTAAEGGRAVSLGAGHADAIVAGLVAYEAARGIRRVLPDAERERLYDDIYRPAVLAAAGGYVCVHHDSPAFDAYERARSVCGVWGRR